MAKVKSASLTLFVSATSTPRHGTATSPATSPVIFVAAPIDLRWSNREYLPPLSCLSFLCGVRAFIFFTAAIF
ncbi:hypothetical protein HID58_004017 [Brassica napus]|uniref:(rape) hypothetical protein n=1 Tax=Brassica napus TaxID=3708 RepID=A0A816XZ82_BRANA|nr:hypothetical protein HID58_004017 [Brassica napus]CAF2069381.1 unnamed protein product [Brassica napus]CAF2154169.1 unnamed protein product [Brassica napus]